MVMISVWVSERSSDVNLMTIGLACTVLERAQVSDTAERDKNLACMHA